MGVAPAHLWVPEGARGSYVDEVADLATLYGRPLDASQHVAVEALTSYGPGGRWLTLETCLKAPRQNGKTAGIVTPIVFADLFLWDADRIAWSAHLFRTCRDAFRDHKQLIDGCAALSRRVRKVTEANGEESIELMSGAMLVYLARSKGGGRGLGGKRVVIDEALFYSEDQAGALLPILAARTNPQITYASSGCKLESDQLRALTKRGQGGADPSLIYVEWKARGGWGDTGCRMGGGCIHLVGTPGCALDDVELWAQANLALYSRIDLEFMYSMRRTLAPLEFGREFLGWDDAGIGGDRPLNANAWEECARDRAADPVLDLVGEPAFFVDVEPGMSAASIAVASLTSAGTPHAELADHRRGTSWLAARCAELKARHPQARWGCETVGAVGAVLPDMAAAGVDIPTEDRFTAGDMGRACGHIQKLTEDRAWTHHPDPLLDAALAAAAKRDIGENQWAWGRRKSAGGISPLVTVTGALWVLASRSPVAPEPWAFYR